MNGPGPPDRAWQRMLSGRRLNLLDPSPLDIEIEDIALGLSRVARWNGQTTGAHGFSVAQHSLLVVDLAVAANRRLPRQARLAALLHDAAEYVTSDLITPFKAAIGDRYKGVEKRITEAVHVRCGLPARLPDAWEIAIKRADGTAAYLEAVQLAGFSPEEARRVLGYRRRAPKIELSPWPVEQARHAFIDRFNRLSGAASRSGPAPEPRKGAKGDDAALYSDDMTYSTIYHMCRREEWEAAQAAGLYPGSSQDRADGFIHFSTAEQIVESAAKHRAGQGGLVLLAVDAAALGDALRWEPSRGGALFPHLYGPLSVSAVVRIDDLPLGPDGRHLFPALD